jgi:arylformamidase
MAYYDISLNLSADTVRWVGSSPYELVERRRIARGDAANSSALSMSAHAGTHLDAPFHFVPDGATIDTLPLEIFMGPAVVYAVEAERYITAEHVHAAPLQGDTRVLFKTRNSALLQQSAYEADFVAFSVKRHRHWWHAVSSWWDWTTSLWPMPTSKCPYTAPFWTMGWCCWKASISPGWRPDATSSSACR